MSTRRKLCAYPLCDVEFVPETRGARFCKEHGEHLFVVPRDIGKDFSQPDIEAAGYDFASWERGFNDAIAAMISRLPKRVPS